MTEEIKPALPSVAQLARKAKQFYPHSQYMRRQWVEKTLFIEKNNLRGNS